MIRDQERKVLLEGIARVEELDQNLFR